ncbi:MAG TPA: DUF1217 domain-containing protein [Rhodopila sp.]|jgi:hypothetical protein|nr:DUF1217 domain-containing protein [Rhodopila sp.]
MGVLNGIDDITGWALLQKNSAAIEKSYLAGTSTASDIAYFKSVAPTITTPDQLLSNYRALTFVTTAYGMSGQQNETALLKQLMTQNPNATGSLAQQLGTVNYLQFASAMSNWNPPPFSTQTGINNAIAGFQQNSFDAAVGQDNPVLQNALYFTQNAQGATTLTQLMSNPTLLSVVTGALGIPSAFGNLSYTQQVAMLTPLVNMSQFSTAAGVASFVNKYVDMSEVAASEAGTSTTSTTVSTSTTATVTSLFSSAVSTGASEASGSDIPQGLTLSASMFGNGTTVNFVA